MLGDIFGGGIDLDFDLDLNDIMDAADEDDGNDENGLLEDSLTGMIKFFKFNYNYISF